MSQPRLLLVDLSSIFWANWHATAYEAVGEAYQRTISRVTYLRDGYDHVAICCDHPPYKRKELSEDYKAQRDAPDAAAVEQLRQVKERLTADGLVLWDAPGYEADDIIATAAGQAEAAGMTVTIATGDKDLCQCIGPSVSLLRVQERDAEKAHMGPEECFAKFGVGPRQMGDLLALCGDKSDNVPGVPGIGPVKAAKLLNSIGTLDAVLEAAAKDDTRIPAKVAAALVEHAATARLSRKLVALATDAPLAFAELYDERTPQPLTDTDYTDDWGDDTDMPDTESNHATTPAPPPLDAEFESIPQATAEVVKADKGTPEKPETTAIVPAVNGNLNPLALEPATSGSAWKLAQMMHNSRLWQHSFNSPEQILAVMLAGRTLGLPAIPSLNGFHVIKGRASPSTELLIGCIKASSKCLYWRMIESTPEHATFETQRAGDPSPTRLTYTIEEAKQADLLIPPKPGKEPSSWIKRPKTMLRWRCESELARIVYPDITAGLYTADEMEDAA